MRIIPITPLFLLIFAMFIFGWSITQYGGISQYGAGFMPCIISELLLFLAAIDVAIDIKHRHRNKVSLTFDEVKALLLVITVVLLFVLLLDILGFVICSFLLLFILMKIRGVRLLHSVIVSISASLIIWFIFARVLLVAFPEGILF
ncbi:tripartite tricarboxylate transporter TctB family protein [Escherichia coli]|nr:tripartite tricarboxylate transporter TctB family protein [Escherichia coli]EKP4674300.1 tripartite tricarboxylate transporter TctB family protein [Escherichia coli]MCN5507004.1 tripartite tricarboxylate transporter TctB family protein [Escherichia coli]